MKKKILILLVTIVSLSLNLLPISTSASVVDAWGNSWEDEEYSEEEIQAILEKDALSYQEYLSYKDKLSEDNSSVARMMPVTRTYTIPVTHYVQEETNWCGPACIRQTLSFHRSKSSNSFTLPSQTAIAKKVGVYGNSNGSSSAVMASTLNDYLSDFNLSGVYVSVDINDKSSPSQFLYSAIRNEILNKTYAPIVLIDTNGVSTIYQYEKYGVKIRHYNTISGIEEVEDINTETIVARSVIRVDPHYNAKYSGEFTELYERLYSSVSYADSKGTNKVLIY